MGLQIILFLTSGESSICISGMWCIVYLAESSIGVSSLLLVEFSQVVFESVVFTAVGVSVV